MKKKTAMDRGENASRNVVHAFFFHSKFFFHLQTNFPTFTFLCHPECSKCGPFFEISQKELSFCVMLHQLLIASGVWVLLSKHTPERERGVWSQSQRKRLLRSVPLTELDPHPCQHATLPEVLDKTSHSAQGCPDWFNIPGVMFNFVCVGTFTLQEAKCNVDALSPIHTRNNWRTNWPKNWWIRPRIEPIHCFLWESPHLNFNQSPNLFRNQKIGFCGQIHTKLFAQFVDELINSSLAWIGFHLQRNASAWNVIQHSAQDLKSTFRWHSLVFVALESGQFNA